MKWYQLALEKHDHVNDINEAYHMYATNIWVKIKHKGKVAHTNVTRHVDEAQP
jgi:hypothetical protein